MKHVITIGQRFLLLALVLVLLFTVTACQPETEEKIANYTDYGAELARTIARHFPYRSPGSDQERRTATYLVQVLASLGYEAELQPFTYTDAEGQRHESQNVVARLSGLGFKMADAEGGHEDHESTIIIGANYDVPVTGAGYVNENLPGDIELDRDYTHYNGIHDNAAGVATVLVTAWQMKLDPPGHNVEFVFFGARNAGYAGARAYLASMSDALQANVVAVYDVGPIYAGEKVYAHAGHNSIGDSTDMKIYHMRRKLYEATDIFFNYQLSTNNDYALYTNQCTFLVPSPAGRGDVVFREWTTATSNYTPFDEAGFPIVYFDSGNYRVDSLAALGPENYAPEFSLTNGRVAGTPYDDDQYLYNVFRRIDEESQTEAIILDTSSELVVGPSVPVDEQEAAEDEPIDHLTRRINNTAFILVKAAQRGPDASALLSR